MASPSDDNEPEILEEEEIIESGFDLLQFWDQYRQIILVTAGVVLLAGVAVGVYEYQQAQRLQAAGAALAQATTEADYQQIMDKYAGTVAAGNASLFLAQKLREDGKYDEAIEVLQTFLDKYPTHPLAHAADLSIGETLEDEKKTDDALAKYQEVAAKYPDSYSAPMAVIAQANLLKKLGKTEEARRLYENFMAQFPDSILTQEAMTEMHLLRPAPGAAAQPTPTGLTGLLSPAAPAPAAAASAPVPTAAAKAPVVPQASAAPKVPVVPGAPGH